MLNWQQDLDDLVAGRALIAERRHWTQGVYARSNDGADVPPEGSRAVCWCSMGAVYRIIGRQTLNSHPRTTRLRALLNIAAKPAYKRIIDTNDHGTHMDVLAAWDKAIATARLGLV